MEFQPVYNTTNSYCYITRNINKDLLETSSNRTLWRRKLIPENLFRICDDKYGGKGLIYCGNYPIPKNTPIIEYVGYVLTEEQYKKSYNSTDKLPVYVIEIRFNKKKLYIDSGKYGNVSRYINHCCYNYNTIFKTMTERNEKVMVVVTTRTVKIGEEILTTYGGDYFSDKDRKCLCEYCV